MTLLNHHSSKKCSNKIKLCTKKSHKKFHLLFCNDKFAFRFGTQSLEEEKVKLIGDKIEEKDEVFLAFYGDVNVISFI